MDTSPDSDSDVSRERAFARVEVVAILGALGLLALLAIPVLANNRAQSDRVVCQSNLRQIGRAYTMWADDHGGKFPQFLSSGQGGNNDNPLCNNVWFQFIWVKVELTTPRILVCPSDLAKRPASDWSASSNGGFNNPGYRNKAVSYVLSLGVLQSPRGFLSGDRNIQPSVANSGGCSGGLLFSGTPALIWDSPTLDWTANLHNKSGNIVLNDGSVVIAGQGELRTSIRNSVRSESQSLCMLYP